MDVIKDAADDYLDYGYKDYRSGDYEYAIIEFNKAIASEPDYAAPYMARADALAKLGKLDGAAKDYDTATRIATEQIARHPESPFNYLWRASVYTRIGEYSRAISDYEAALEIDASRGASHLYYDEPFSPYILRGDSFCEIGEYERAIEDFSRAIEIHDDNTVALIRRGRLNLERSQFKEAEADLIKARDIHLRLADHYGQNPDDNFGIDDKGDPVSGSEMADREYGKAEVLRPFLSLISSKLGRVRSKQRMTKGVPRKRDQQHDAPHMDFDYYFREGTVHLQNEEYGAAVRDFDSAIKLNQFHADSHCNRAIASAGLGHYNKAIEFFERGVEIDTKVALEFTWDIAPAYLQRGVATKGKSPSTAMEAIKTAISLRPDLEVEARAPLAVAHYTMGMRKLRKRRYTEAISDFDKSIELQPDYADAFSDRGNAFAHLGDYTRAFEDCTKAIELSPHTPAFFDNRGKLFSERGEHDKAVEDYCSAIDAAPAFGLIWLSERAGASSSIRLTQAVFGERRSPDHLDHFHTGLAYSDSDDYDKAIAHYTKAIELNSEYAVAYNNRGMLYGRRGEYARALEDFEQALRVDPSYSQAQRNRQTALRRLQP